ncbi:hypothetical protein ABD07_03885 [Nitrosomonas oligotropha]|nr:hypothetical protein [Nitrosomonas oligotropha]
MQITDEENEVKLRELIKEIYKFAKRHNEPFTTAEAFEQVKDADDNTAVSNATRTLYIEGKLARKKIDGVRYSYVLIENATEDYETVNGIKPVAAGTEPDGAETKPESHELKPSVSETKTPVLETKQPPKVIKQPALKPAELEKGNLETDANPLEFKVSEALKLPEHFSLRLETPGGITITISAGA